MAFVKATIQILSALVGTGIKASIRKGKSTGAKMSLGVTTATAKDLDWTDGNMLDVMIGEGEHHGLIRVRKNNSVGEAKVERRETAKGSWFQVQLGCQPAFVDRSEAQRWCQWEKVEDGWIEIVLPKWADETAPTKSKALPSSTSLPHRPAPARQTVTASVMGDPPPGRREMLAKIGSIKG
jgi:hypothetical protein